MVDHSSKSDAGKVADSLMSEVVDSIETISTEVQAIKDKTASSIPKAFEI